MLGGKLLIKVITYGTYDLLHYGHINLLKRAKALGDFLIVGVTADDFDRVRGKINVQQTLEERIAAIRNLETADQINVEEDEGQKIDDIKRYEVDIFTVGSDWKGYFDYLNEYCQVIYLSRTEGISSSRIRTCQSKIRMGMLGYSTFLNKFYNESKYVNAVNIVGLCTNEKDKLRDTCKSLEFVTEDYNEFLNKIDAVYIHSHPKHHYFECKKAILQGKHVLCESPVSMSVTEFEELKNLSIKYKCILMEAIRTAYITAYLRLLLLLKSGKIGDIVSVDATCTSLKIFGDSSYSTRWGAFEAWGPTTLLPVFQMLGTDYSSVDFFSIKDKYLSEYDLFTKVNISYPKATATIKVGTGVKSEGELIVSGTKGYAYVPAPWWKTNYFEIRYENPADNKRYFYQVEGEGIRYELVALANAIRTRKPDYYISEKTTREIANFMELFNNYYRSINF